MKRCLTCFLVIMVVGLLTSCFCRVEKITEDRVPYLTGGTEQTTAPAATVVTTHVNEMLETVQETSMATMNTVPENDDVFVRVVDYVPGIVIDLKYATEDNFTGQVIYTSDEAWLRYGTVKKLIKVQEVLSNERIYLKLWDGFRPPAAQFKLWEICPDPTYVADPNKGFSSHSRGNTVDITLVDIYGEELEMPTGFDDFSKLADRNYSDCTETAAVNARLLQEVMEENGFRPYFGEWWHFTDTDSYDVETEFVP